jgi:hypothetical protein
MNIQQIIDYIEHRNVKLYSSRDDFDSFVLDSFGNLTNSSARTLMTNLLIGDDKAAAQILRDCLVKEYGEKAEAFADEQQPEEIGRD